VKEENPSGKDSARNLLRGNRENCSDARPKVPELGTGPAQEVTAGTEHRMKTNMSCPDLPQEDEFWPGIKVKNEESNVSFNQTNYPGFTASHSPNQNP
jgi:hypothetical protein